VSPERLSMCFRYRYIWIVREASGRLWTVCVEHAGTVMQVLDGSIVQPL